MATETLLTVYLIIGIVLAFWFAFYKVPRLDADAKHSPITFKLLLIPATVLLWPVILFQIRKNKNHEPSSSSKA